MLHWNERSVSGELRPSVFSCTPRMTRPQCFFHYIRPNGDNLATFRVGEERTNPIADFKLPRAKRADIPLHLCSLAEKTAFSVIKQAKFHGIKKGEITSVVEEKLRQDKVYGQ